MNFVGQDLFIYGDIEDNFDAEWLARRLNECGGADVTVRINSAGGNVFSALAISNALRNYAGKTTASIEGCCASAAVLISSSCQRVQIAANSLMMTHAVSVMLERDYNAAQLAGVQDALSKIQSAYELTIKPRLKKPIDFSVETWFTAQEAVEYGLADEIAGQVSMQIDAAQDLIFVNKQVFNAHVPLMTASTSKPKNDVAAQILALISDQLKSGAEGVFGGQHTPSQEEIKKARVQGIADLANSMI